MTFTCDFCGAEYSSALAVDMCCSPLNDPEWDE